MDWTHPILQTAPGANQPILQIVLVQIILFFKSSWCKSSYSLNRPGAIHPVIQNLPRQKSLRGKELNTFFPPPPPTEATTFAFSSVFILLLYDLYWTDEQITFTKPQFKALVTIVYSSLQLHVLTKQLYIRGNTKDFIKKQLQYIFRLHTFLYCKNFISEPDLQLHQYFLLFNIFQPNFFFIK